MQGLAAAWGAGAAAKPATTAAGSSGKGKQSAARFKAGVAAASVAKENHAVSAPVTKSAGARKAVQLSKGPDQAAAESSSIKPLTDSDIDDAYKSDPWLRMLRTFVDGQILILEDHFEDATAKTHARIHAQFAVVCSRQQCFALASAFAPSGSV